VPKPQFSVPPPERVRSDLLKLLERKPLDAAALNVALRLLAKYRSHLVQWEVANNYGARIQGGPFAGMDFIDHGSHGSHVPKLIGCYEHELHPAFEAVIAEGYEDVINVGCAEGYYAVGLALRMPAARIHAYDTDPNGRALCQRVAKQNGLEDRIQMGELFTPEMFGRHAGRKAFYLIDIEGAERELLAAADPGALADADLIIECHDIQHAQVSGPLRAQLEATHEVALVANRIASPELPPLFEPLGEMDRLLAIWEWRGFPTPWLVAASRRRPQSALARLARG
jgi:hypothetical protein